MLRVCGYPANKILIKPVAAILAPRGAAKGMDTRRLQHFLGHASITNTVRYTAMSPEPFKDVWR
jgi:hypothetical protein